MKKILLSIFLVISTFLKLFSQELIWAYNIGSVGFDAAYSLKTDDVGNVYIAGTFVGMVDFDPGIGVSTLTATGGSDAFFAKYDSNGNLIWVKHIGGNLAERSSALALDTDGNIIVTGYFQEFIDLDPSVAVFELESSADNEIFIAKYDNDGNFIWGGQIEGSGNEIAYTVETDNDGNIYIGGIITIIADFDLGPGDETRVSVGNDDGFVVKYSPDGDFIWVMLFSGDDVANVDAVLNLKVDMSGNVYVTGYFQGTMDIDNDLGIYTITSQGYFDGFIAKYDTDANLLWGFNLGGTNYDIINDISIDDAGNVYVVGVFTDLADFDPGIGVFNQMTDGSSDGFIAKYDIDGNFQWAGKVGDNNYDEITSIDIDPNGNILLSGLFEGTVDFDYGVDVVNMTSSGGGEDIFIATYDENGEYIWAIKLEKTNVGIARKIKSDNLGNLYILGDFQASIDMDPSALVYNLNTAGSYDILFAKYTTGIVLSQELFSFQAKKNNNTTDITWKMSSTKHIKGFEVEKSIDGKSYNLLSKIHAHPQMLDYNITDYHPSFGTNYYRLKLIYENEKIEYSNVQLVSFSNTFNATLFPNPAKDYIQLSISHTSTPSQVIITNVQGQVVKTISNYHSEDKINISELASGTYFITTQIGTQVETYSFIKK